jgi:hypothetical protein
MARGGSGIERRSLRADFNLRQYCAATGPAGAEHPPVLQARSEYSIERSSQLSGTVHEMLVFGVLTTCPVIRYMVAPGDGDHEAVNRYLLGDQV